MNSSGFLTLLAQAAAPAGEAAGAAQDAAISAPTTGPSYLGWIAFAVLIGVVFVPFALGQVIAKALKMREAAFRIGVTIFALTLGLAPFVTNFLTTGNIIAGAIPLGIDLEGGTNLVYRVDHEATRDLGKSVDNETMERMVAAIRNRVAPGGTEEVAVRQVGDDRIEVIVPGADPERIDRIKSKIVDLGSLEFSIVVNSQDHPELYQQGQEQVNDPEAKDIRIGGVLRARWVPVAFDTEGNPKIAGLDGGELIRPATVAGKSGYEILVLNEPDARQRITGDYLVNAREEFQAEGPVVGFTFNQQGGYLFQNLTWRYQPKEGDSHRTKLAILLSGRVHSAPQINAVIGSSGVIQGNFTSAEIDELISVLNAGALDVPLIEHPVSEFTVSPLLGADVREKGMTAIYISAVAVFGFMLAYYWTAGIVADISLLINVVLVMGVMSLIDATFTLPGLAGLVLVIGMAVDANVLIFERIREEQNKGASLRMSINNGFGKALSTIIDSNLTTLITAVVLYIIGTDQVKGFAVTLFIGITTSVFTTVYVGRLMFDIMERKRWIKSLPMASLIRTPRVNFVSKTTICILGSIVLAIAGIGGVVSRGADNFDIDFSGGVMVTFQFEDPKPEIDEVRELLEDKLGGSITVEELTVGEGDAAQRLVRLRTTDDDAERVSQLINDAFEGTEHELIRQQVTTGEIAAIPAAPESETGGADDPASRFAGGRQVTVNLSQPMLASSLAEEVSATLASIDAEKYTDSDLIGVTAKEAPAGAKGQEFLVQAESEVDAADFQQALTTLQTDLETEPFFTEKNTFDTSVGKEMQLTAVAAIVLSLAAIVFYLWFRFQGVTFGFAAIAALVHDVTIVLGLVALCSYAAGSPVGQMLGLMDFKINLPMIAAFLTIVGYSLNDTIVVFDRIREVRGKNPNLTAEMINASVNQTLSRTILTSLTTLIVVLILYAIGGEGIHGFAFCLLIGIMVGTYSSIFIASPILLWLMNRNKPKTAAA